MLKMDNINNLEGDQISKEVIKKQQLRSSLEKWAQKNQKIVIVTSQKLILVCATSILLNATTVLANEKSTKEGDTKKEESLTSGFYYMNEKAEVINNQNEIIGNISYEKLSAEVGIVQLEEGDLEDGMFDEVFNEMLDEYMHTQEKKEQIEANYIYYDIPLYDQEFQDYIYDTATKWNVPYRVPFVIIEVASNGAWDNNGVVSSENYGLTQINQCNLSYIEEQYGYTEEQVLSNPYINVECCIRLLHDCVLPNVEVDVLNPNYEEILGFYCGWINWRIDEAAVQYVNNALTLLNTKYSSPLIQNISLENSEQVEVHFSEEYNYIYKTSKINPLEVRNYYSISNFENEFQDYIYDTATKWNVPYKLAFTFIDIESGGTWATNGVISKTNDYGLCQINQCNLAYIEKNYGYTEEEIRYNPYINVECCIRLLHDQFLPAAYFDENNPDYESVFGVYNGWVTWRDKKGSQAYVKKAMNILNTKYSMDFICIDESVLEEKVQVVEEEMQEDAMINAEEKYFIRLYTDIYGLDYETVYKILSENTANFTDENYTNAFIIPNVTFENKQVSCSSKEMSILIAVHAIYNNPTKYNYSYNGFIPEATYMLNEEYAKQIDYVSSVIGVDRSLTYAICQTGFGFESPMFFVNKNPSGIKIGEEYASYPTVTAGFIETALKILEGKIEGHDTIPTLSRYFGQTENLNWISLVTYFDTYYQEHYDELYEKGKVFTLE